MATSYREFQIELYEEHLEEASFLYEQRLGWFEDAEIAWRDIAEIEERLEPHIDALVVGGELALDICQRQAEEGDFGELYTALCVFCRQSRRDLLAKILKDLDAEDVERVQAVTDALKDEIPEDWMNLLVGNLDRGFQKLVPVVAEIAGYRRLPYASFLINLRPTVGAADLPKLFWSLGRFGERAVVDPLLADLDHEEDEVSASAALALMRLGSVQALKQSLKRLGQGDQTFVLPAAIAGDQATAQTLRNIGQSNLVQPDCILAMGVSGELAAVKVIFNHLEDPALAESAAMALQLITGADLIEEAFIPEEIDEDELFDEELEKYRQGEAPKHADGRPFGTNITRLSQNQDDWRRWLEDNKARFDPRFRYRRGKPFSLQALLDTLTSEYSSHRVRKLAYDELAIRYELDIPFEADMRVFEQMQRLNLISQWVQANEQRFQPGLWYFAGRPMA